MAKKSAEFGTVRCKLPVFLPVAQDALSHGALHVIHPALKMAASHLLEALARTAPSTVLRNSRRFCRSLIQSLGASGAGRPSTAPPSLRAASYRAVATATLQLGPAATPHLAVPALPTLLAEVRAVISASDTSATDYPPDAAGAVGGGRVVRRRGTAAGGGGGSSSGGGSMKIEPAMSARKSSQKKQRKARDREVGRALAAADAAAAAVAAGGGDSAGITAGDGGGGAAVGWNRNGGGSADVELREAACGALSCLSQVVLTCGAYLPMSPRLAVEDLLHRGLGVLVRAGVRGRSCGGGGGAAYRGRGVGPAGCLPLEDPRVAREFVTLAQACLVTPLTDGTRSGALSVAVGAFRSFRTHPDKELAKASQLALAGCGALLYPKSAPLHLPHSVTSQARAWGTSVGGGRGSEGLPFGWDGVLEVGEDRTLSQDEEQEEEEEEEEEKVAPKAVVVTPRPTNKANPISTSHGSVSQNPAAAVQPPAAGVRMVVDHEPTTSESYGGGGSDSGGGKKWKGKGKGREREGGEEQHKRGISGGDAQGSGGGRGGGVPEDADAHGGGSDGGGDDQETPRRKRPRNTSSHVVENAAEVGRATEAAAAAGAVGVVGPGETRETGGRSVQGASSVVPVVAAVGSGAGSVDEEDEEDDDDDLDLPSIIDADPDED